MNKSNPLPTSPRGGVLALFTFIALTIVAQPTASQETIEAPSGAVGGVLHLSLDDCIAMARRQSIDAAMALDELRSAYWQWRSYKANLLPEVSLQGTLPSYNKRYQLSAGRRQHDVRA